MCSLLRNQSSLLVRLGMAEQKKNVEYRDHIPEEIVLQILLRLPAKSLGRFVSVSKLWARIIRGQDFIRCFSSRSCPKKQPRFILAFNNEIKGYQENWSFFSRSTTTSRVEEQAPDFLSSTVCQLKSLRYKRPSYAHGLISFLYGKEQVVCNPTTGKSITLPNVTVKSTEMIVRSFLGYDPIDAQYKVLCLSNLNQFCELQVLTLGSTQTQSCSWRTIQCSPPHYALGINSVCIGGVLYYIASASSGGKEPFLAGFDLRSETLVIASMFPEGFGSEEPYFLNHREALLINCHGKVALVLRRVDKGKSFPMWLLKDAKKREWSKERLYIPKDGTRADHCNLEMVGASGSGIGEFLYAPVDFEDLSVYFVDHKSKRSRPVQLQGNTTHQFRDFYQVFTFLHHVETLMFI